MTAKPQLTDDEIHYMHELAHELCSSDGGGVISVRSSGTVALGMVILVGLEALMGDDV